MNQATSTDAQIAIVLVTIDTYGKYGNKYGPDVYKVGSGVRQLAEAGWVAVHRGDSYTYMRARAGRGAKRVRVPVSVPTRDTVRNLAERLHTAGVAWRGEVCGWPASYAPHVEGTHIDLVIGMELDQATNKLRTVERHEPRHYVSPASFSLGEPGVWDYYARWNDGPTSPPRWFEPNDA